MDYQSYLKIRELLDLQHEVSDGPEHDEMLFIVAHQVYELWFKVIIHETTALISDFREGSLACAGARLKRIRSVLKTLVAQVDILETMSPRSFLSFRDRLEAASGFQSAQFRLLEFTLGAKKQANMQPHLEGTPERAELQAAFEAPTLYDAFWVCLAEHGYPIPKQERDFTQWPEATDALQDVLVDVYDNDAMLTEICEFMVDIDEGLQEWRYRHVKMVERTIGLKIGTGGSSGAEYLRSTLFRPLFPDLWAVRTRL